MSKVYLIDPTGINLPAEPISGTVTDLSEGLANGGTTVFGRTVFGASDRRYSFQFDCSLTQDQYDALQGLYSLLLKDEGEREIIVYNLYSRVSDTGTAPERSAVPATLVESTAYGVLTRFTYYPILQGFIEVLDATLGGACGDAGERWRVTIKFTEGTVYDA